MSFEKKIKIIISKRKLLLVEGSHEKQFFLKLLEKMQIIDIQVEPIGGKYLFKPNIELLPKLDNYDIVKSIGIVRDADDSYKDTFISVKNALKNADLPIPEEPMKSIGNNPKINVFIMPNNKSNGYLEQLCIMSVESDPIFNCVRQYFNCLKEKQGKVHPRIFKAKVQVYLAKEPDGDIHMGIAAKRDIWQWDNSVFDDIKRFLKSL